MSDEMIVEEKLADAKLNDAELNVTVITEEKPNEEQANLTTNNPVVIKQPLFFRLTHNNKTAYMLGTFHILTANILPEECLALIESCKVSVSESLEPSLELWQDIKNNFLTHFGRRPQDEDWFAALSPRNQYICSGFFKQGLIYAFDEYAPDVEVKDIRLPIAFYIIDKLADILIVGLFAKIICKHYLQDENASSDAFMGNMDIEIEAPFAQRYGLEECFNHMFLSVDDEPDPELLVQELEFIVDYFDDESTKPKYDAEDEEFCINMWEDYRDGLYLTDMSKSFDLDKDDAEENFKLKKRNAEFIVTLLKYFEELPDPFVVTFGADHLIGKDGMLILLDAAGVKVEVYDANHNGVDLFKPYDYSKLYFAAREKLKLELLFSGLRNNPVVGKKQAAEQMPEQTPAQNSAEAAPALTA